MTVPITGGAAQTLCNPHAPVGTSHPLHIVNNGHTIQINYAPGSFITVGEKR